MQNPHKISATPSAAALGPKMSELGQPEAAPTPSEQPIAILVDVDDAEKSLDPSNPIGLVQAEVLPNPKIELSSNPPPPNVDAKPAEPTVKIMTKSMRQREKRRAKISIIRLKREAAEGKVNGVDGLLRKESTVAASADVAAEESTVAAGAVVAAEESRVAAGADVAVAESTVLAGVDGAEEKTKAKRRREKIRARILMERLNSEAAEGNVNGGDELLPKTSTVAAGADVAAEESTVVASANGFKRREKRRAKILIMERLKREAAEEGKVNGGDELLRKESIVAASADVAGTLVVAAGAIADVQEESTVAAAADVAEEKKTINQVRTDRISAIFMEKLNHDAVETKVNGGDELLLRKAAGESTIAACADVAEENKVVAKIDELGIKMSKGSRKRKRKAEKKAAMMSTVGTDINVNNGIEAKIGDVLETKVNEEDEPLPRKVEESMVAASADVDEEDEPLPRKVEESMVAASADVLQENKAVAKIGEVMTEPGIKTSKCSRKRKRKAEKKAAMMSTVGTGIDVDNGIEAKIGDVVTVITDEATPTAKGKKELRKRRAERKAEMRKIMMNEEMEFRKRMIEKNNKEMMEVKRVREKYEAEVMKRMMEGEMENRRQKLYSEFDAICVICRRRGHVIASCPEPIDEPVVEKSKRKRLCPVVETLMTDETSGGKEDESVVKKSKHKRLCPVEETLMTDETSGGKEDESVVKKSEWKRLCPVEETLTTDETSGGKEDESVVKKSKWKKLCPAEETLMKDEKSGCKESESVVKKSKRKRLCPVEETLRTDETSGGKEDESVVKKSKRKRLCPAEETLRTDETSGDKEDESIVKHSEVEKMLGCAPEDTLKKDETSDGKHDEYIVENSQGDMLNCSAETSGSKDEKCILKNVEEDQFLGSTAAYKLKNEETSGGEEYIAKVDSASHAEETHVKPMMEQGPGVVNPVA